LVFFNDVIGKNNIFTMGALLSSNVVIHPSKDETLDNSDIIARDILQQSHNPKIIGSYIYKRLLRGERVRDVDAVSNDVTHVAMILRSKCGAIDDIMNEEDFKNYHSLQMRGMHVDLVDEREYKEKIGDDTFINTIMLSSNGLQHKRGIILETIPKTTTDTTTNTTTDTTTNTTTDTTTNTTTDAIPATLSNRFDLIQMKYVIHNLREGKYCRWSNMREKDKVYFGKLKEIPKEECELYGFFNKVG